VIKLRLQPSGAPEQIVQVEGDALTIGRTQGCDVVINQPYLSKRHVRILHGLVVVDLGSSNGTFIDGERLREATLLRNGRLTLGNNDLVIEVETGDIDLTSPAPGYGSAAAPAEVARLEAELERYRSRTVLLEMDLERMQRERLAVPKVSPAEAQLDELRSDNRRLVQRVESLKGDIEARERADAGSIQAKLATDRLQLMQARTDELERKLADAEKRAARAAVAPQDDQAQKTVERLTREADERKLEFVRVRGELDAALHAQGQARESTETVRRLREEIERLRAAPPAPVPTPAAGAPIAGIAGELIGKLQRDNSDLKRRNAELEARGAAPAAGAPAASELFFKLTSENSELKRRIAALEVGGPPQQGASASVAELENRSRVLQREVERLQASLATRAAAPPVPAIAPARVIATGSGVGELLRTLMNDDIGTRTPLLRGPADEFVVLEQFRFLRSVERVVTRMAAEFIQLYQAHTVLPDTEGNFRGLAATVFSEPNSEAARQELVKYIEELGKWLVVALAAHRQAAARFAEQLKHDLSERALVGDKAIGAFAKLAGKGEAELWRRAALYLRDLTPDMVDDRLEKLARDAAGELLNKPREA
jgi:uncharacterized small protein (DUF1192 family)